MIDTDKLQVDINTLVENHYKLKFLLTQIRNGKLEISTWTPDGFHRDISFKEILEIIHYQEDWEVQ